MAVALSLAPYLRAMEQDLPPELLGPQSVKQIVAVADTLPPLPMVGFEARLGTGDPAPHFAVAVRAAQGDRDIILRRLDHAHPDPDSAWGRIDAFCRDWAEPSSPTHGGVPSLWLEYDVDAADHPPPGVFFGTSIGEVVSASALVERSVALLTGAPVPPDVREAVIRVVRTLPSGSNLFQVGTVVARPAPALRLCIVARGRADVPQILSAAGWPGPVEDVESSLAALPVSPSLIALDIDIGTAVMPRIGLECYMDERRQPRVDPSWQKLLDHLVVRGMCTVAQRDALLAWPGREQVRILWNSAVIRGLNHLKLVLEPGRPAIAKAYFGFVHR